MIFFEPKELLGLAEGDRGFSFARLMFAERREGFDGNGAAYRWVSRLLNPQTKLTDKNTTKLLELISGKIAVTPLELEEMTSKGLASQMHVLPWYSFIHGADAVAGGELTDRFPKTLELVYKLDTLSRIARHHAERNDRDTLIKLVRDLPLSSSTVPNWVCERLQTGNSREWDAAFFLLRVVLFYATLAYMSDELDAANDNDRGNVRPVFLCRDEKSGNPRPFRPCFERILELTGERTFEGLFKSLFGGDADTRIRRGRQYMAAPPNQPSTKACLGLVHRAKKKYGLEARAVEEMKMMFSFARLVTGIYVRCGKLLSDLPGLDPNSVMDEIGIKWMSDRTEDEDILRHILDYISDGYSSSE